MKRLANWVLRLLGSRRFYIFVLVFFAFESMWVALSAVYPQAFDEDFHFGLIKIYSHYWLPFLGSQPKGGNMFGAVARDPSYLYHYLMSFPYRLIAFFTSSQTIQVILLRIINIGLFGGGLIFFRRILLKIKVSPNLANTVLFLFVLIPVVPILSAQINYDNMVFLAVGWACLLTFNVIDQVRQHKLSARSLLILLSVCTFASLVKYSFLPIFAAVVVFLAAMAYRYNKKRLKQLWNQLLASFKSETKLVRVGLLALFLLSVGMFIQRDGVNFIEYHSIDPNCQRVLSIQQCKAYSVWENNYLKHLQVESNPNLVSNNVPYYVASWFYWMWYRLFFAVNGPNSTFTNYPPLPLPSAAAILIAVGGVVAIVKWRHKLFHNKPYSIFLLTASAFYLTALFVDGYTTYRYTSVLEFMNGRYLLPIMLMVAALAAKAVSMSMENLKTYKALIALVILFLFLEGGGFLTFIARSDTSWDWPNTTVVKVNNAARHITKPVLVKGQKTYNSKIWFFN